MKKYKYRAFQADVVYRMFDNNEKKIAEFIEDYQEHRLRSGGLSAITDKDLKMAADYRKGMTTRELSQKYKMRQTLVISRLRAVAMRSLRD